MYSLKEEIMVQFVGSSYIDLPGENSRTKIQHKINKMPTKEGRRGRSISTASRAVGRAKQKKATPL